MVDNNFERKPITCPDPKCGSGKMLVNNVQEMFWNRYQHQPPIPGAVSEIRVVCAICGKVAWSKEMYAKKDGKKEKK